METEDRRDKTAIRETPSGKKTLFADFVRRHLSIGLISGLIAVLFSFFPIIELIEMKGYDLFHRFKKASPSRDIVLVAIDEPSFAEIGIQWPWPRSLHGRLIDSLKKEGASAIGLDIVFSEPSSPSEDRLLADAIKRAGNVVLASDLELIADEKYTQEMIVEPISILSEEASTGIATIPLDRDHVVRRFYPLKEGETLFSEQVSRVHSGKTRSVPRDAYISYTGPPRSFATVSYYQALEPSAFLPKNYFRDKIVLVGRAVKYTPDLRRTQSDVFAVPFLFSKMTSLMNGVEIQANMVNDLLRGEFVTKGSRLLDLSIFLLMGLIGSLLQIRWKPVTSAAMAIVCFSLYLAAAYFAFERLTLWIPTFLVALPVFLPYAIFGIEAYVRSEKKRKEIRKTFSHYLSPSILENVLAHPESLRLGGEKVEATVLFSDIAGFTTIAEGMAPEEVANLLNRYFGEMTKIIFEYKGTVDKFIGDGVMAFWGAPVPDSDHALNACRAAISMQRRLKSFREELQGLRLPEIFIRIGIHTGPVIVGNMGSSELFDYTALGDTVNLASRLEGANKEFGTSVMISHSVYEKVANRVKARPLGSIKVKGKSKETGVYELMDVVA
jgi:adenylate cyclase